MRPVRAIDLPPVVVPADHEEGRMEQEPGPSRQSRGVLRLIAVFKLCKAALLVAVGLGTLQLVHPGVATQAQSWVEPLVMTSARHAIQRLIGWLSGLSPRRLEVLALGAFLYSCLYTIEGVGLWLAKRWAEYLVAVATLLFVPLEVFALTRHMSVTRVTALVVNLTVAAYLIHRLRDSGRAARTSGHAAGS